MPRLPNTGARESTVDRTPGTLGAHDAAWPDSSFVATSTPGTIGWSPSDSDWAGYDDAKRFGWFYSAASFMIGRAVKLATGVAAPPVLSLHKAHFVVLFAAMQAADRYGKPIDAVVEVTKAMKTLESRLGRIIRLSLPVPEPPGFLIGAVLSDPDSCNEQVQALLDHVKSFVALLDAECDLIREMLIGWTGFLTDVRKFLRDDKPSTTFAVVGKAGLAKQCDLAWLDAERFNKALNRFVGHRNKYASRIGLEKRPGFGNWFPR